MLAERKQRVKWSLNPRGNLWSQDTSKFGQQMLEKMGWTPGSGLGANEQGITEHIKVAYKSDKKCIGYKEHGDEWLEQQSQFENLLAELGSSHDTAMSDKGNESLELRSQQSRARVHYHKFTRGKDLSNYTDKDLACILGVKKPSDTPDYSSVKARKNDVDTLIGKVDNLYGIMTVNGGNMNDYFVKKKHRNVDAAEENQAELQCEKDVGMELGESVSEAQIETKKKQNRKIPESSYIEGKDVDTQETEENKLALNGDNTYGSNCKKKKRKFEQKVKGEQLLKDDERNYERHTKPYSEKDAYNFQEKGNIIKQELKRKKKQKENPDMDREEVEQKTDGNEMNDNSAHYLNYKAKKRKLEQEAKGHLLEEEIMKQDGRSVESYIEKDLYSCEVENNKMKKKKKQKEKEKCTESPDAYGNEAEIYRNETLLNDVHINGLNCKKKKSKFKQEVKERIQDETTEPGEAAKDDFDGSAPTSCYRSKRKCKKNSLQKNDEYQYSVTAGDMTAQDKDSFKKLKNGKTSGYRDSEKESHCEMKDTEIMEEETRKHKKKNKHKDKVGTINDIQEHSLVQHNLEETQVESCDRKNCEEPSVIGETNVVVNCAVRKEKGRKRKILNQICTSEELECDNDERIQEQDTETNQQNSETATQKDKTQNIEGSKEARNNSKCTEDVCNSDVQNSTGAADRTTGVNRRNMRPSVFAQLVDPSLIKFRGSNLSKIPGYGCY